MAHKKGSKSRATARKPQQGQRRPKRRFDVLLPTDTGAEVQLPALPEIRLGARLLASVLLIAVLGAAYLLVFSGTFRIAGAEVFGTDIMSESVVRSIAKIDGMPIFFVDPAGIAERLRAYPEVKAVEVTVEWPNKVVIHVVEREPLVVWDDGGRKWWLCADGVAFLEREALPGMVTVIAETQVLQIQDDPLAQVIDPDVLRSAVSLATLLPEAGNFRYVSDYGLILEDERGWTAYFGADGDMAMKVRVYVRIAEMLQEQGRRVSTVSVVDPGSPYYTLAR
jgi:cell division septal protein FtsQ